MTTYLASLQASLHALFKQADDVYLLGEDLLDPYGGAFKVSKGLSSQFPGRVLNTPICEGGFTGVAAGMALRGLKPIVEIMFGDFLTLCMDQIVNHITKFRGMYNDQVRVPIVIRTPMGGGRGYGATHSQSLEKLFLGLPNIHIVAPSHFHDPGSQLIYSVLHKNDPVLFIEHKLLYSLPLIAKLEGMTVEHVEEVHGYPTVIVSNFLSGSPDVTVITYGGISRFLVPFLEAMAKEEIRVTVALPASLKPLPIETLIGVAEKSGKVIIVEEGTQGFNWGSEVAAQLYERLFNRLRKPILRVATADQIIPVARNLEDRVIVNPMKIEQAIEEILS